jgi:hypothetical protein
VRGEGDRRGAGEKEEEEKERGEVRGREGERRCKKR